MALVFAGLLLAVLVGGCAPTAHGIVRVALLAPFEGPDRLIGYEALYAARMAAADVGDLWLELLPVDDGAGQAIERVRALAEDRLVMVVIVVGDIAGGSELNDAAPHLPVVMVGSGTSHGENYVYVIPSQQLPDATFRERYLSENAFAPEPGALARAVYDAAMAGVAAAQKRSRIGAAAYLSERLG